MNWRALTHLPGFGSAKQFLNPLTPPTPISIAKGKKQSAKTEDEKKRDRLTGGASSEISTLLS